MTILPRENTHADQQTCAKAFPPDSSSSSALVTLSCVKLGSTAPLCTIVVFQLVLF